MFLFTLGLLVSGSWDQQVKVWDPRQKKCLGTYDQTERVSITYEIFNKKETDWVATLKKAGGKNYVHERVHPKYSSKVYVK